MGTLTTTSSVADDTTDGRASTWRKVLADLTKIRLSALVLVTAAVGFVLGSAGALDGWLFPATLLGVGLLAGGSSALNQCLETGPDSLMERTRERPLPAQRISARSALVIALGLSVLGAVVLHVTAGLLPALLGVATVVIYVVLYTPLKRVTTLCTPVGAVVGALPPVIGWTAAAGRIETGALVLAAIMFIWQIPHFLAIAWLYREDYARGGFRMLPVVDESGRTTFSMVLLYTGALVPVTLAALTLPSTGWLYAGGALILGAAFFLSGLRFCRERSRSAARTLFLTSIAYLPLLFALMVLDPTGANVRGLFS